jgi:serine/threonine protein kinase
MSLAAGAHLGPYEVLSPLGAGGMGEVWKARDTRLNRTVAIKTSAAAFSDRFQSEAHAVAALNHPNICTLYDVGPDYLVMELIEGESPAGPLPVETAIDYARQIAAALEAAHEKGIVHRDLKPANIKVTPKGVVKVLDFGLAKMAEPAAAGATAATQTMTISGTPGYMAPEQLNGKPADARSDIFSFGCVLYELLSGQRAFAGNTMAAALAATTMTEPKPIVNAPPELERLLRRCLQKDPARRAQCIADVRLALEDLEEAPETAPALPPARLAKDNRLALAAAGVMFLAAAGLAVVHFREKPPRPPEPHHFRLPLPQNATFSPTTTVALSPDGRHVAFSASNSQGFLVFVQDTDGGEAHALPGTNTSNATPPFYWSPDSRYVAFSYNGSVIDKVDIASGAVEKICDKPGPPVGGSWNLDNIIIFGSTTTGLWRVPAGAGKAVPLTKLDASRHERQHQLPSFLPDGRHFIYLATSVDYGQSGIYAASLDDSPSQKPRRILTSDFGARFVPGENGGPGWLLYLRDGSLVAQVFDPARLALKGDPMPVPARVGTAYQTPLFSASPDLLVYRTGRSARSAQLTWVDAKTGKAAASVGEIADLGRSALSPDETRVAYEKDFNTASSESDLWVLDLVRGGSTRLTLGGAYYGSPVWSPDGGEIAYLKIAGALAARGEIFKKRADGSGEEELLLRAEDFVRPTSWSSDGKYLLFSSSKTPNFLPERIGVLPLHAGAKPFAFSPPGAIDETAGQFSPDGRYVAYASAETGRREIYVRPFSPDPSAPAGGKWMISSQGGVVPRWSQDGRKLYWADSPATGQVMAADIDTSHGFRAGAPVRLYGVGPISGVPSYLSRRGQGLFVVPVKTEAPEPLNVLVNWRSTLQPR